MHIKTRTVSGDKQDLFSEMRFPALLKVLSVAALEAGIDR
jgi:hypothetical protein